VGPEAGMEALNKVRVSAGEAFYQAGG
jgi:hypothetical protein